MMRGLANVSFWADDLDAAKQWYTDLLGIAPYFERPGYIEFRIGDFQHELGIIDGRYAPSAKSGPSGAIVYWHVDDVTAVFEKLLSLGAKEYQPVTAQGNMGFITASVVDPFGNVLGVMQNPHYLQVLEATKNP